MMSRVFVIETTSRFERVYRKLIKKDRNLSRIITETVKRLSKDPFQENLRTHKVMSRNY